MNTKRWRLLIVLIIVVVLAAFSVLRHTRWKVRPTDVIWSWFWYLPLTPDRPVWEDQVLSPDEILPGQILIFHDYQGKKNNLMEEFEIAIVSKPYELDGQCRFDYVFLPITWETYYIHYMSCAYVGLEPYVNGWHRLNYLSDTGRRRLKLEITFLNLWLIRDENFPPQRGSLPVMHEEDCIIIDTHAHQTCWSYAEEAP